MGTWSVPEAIVDRPVGVGQAVDLVVAQPVDRQVSQTDDQVVDPVQSPMASRVGLPVVETSVARGSGPHARRDHVGLPSPRTLTYPNSTRL